MKNKKALIISAATRLFAKQGFERTSISEIILEANVSKGLVYHYFESKDELLREIIRSTSEKMFKMSEQSKKNTPSVKMLLDIINEIFNQLETQKEFYRFNLSLMFQPNLRSLLSDLIHERATHLFQKMFKIFQTIGSKDPQFETFKFIAEIDGIALDYLSVFDEYPLEKMKQYLLNKYKA